MSEDRGAITSVWPGWQDMAWHLAEPVAVGTSPLPRPATHESILNGWPGGGAGWCRLRLAPPGAKHTLAFRRARL